LDWAEPCVGHPFLTFQYLLEHLRRLRPVEPSWETELLSAYVEYWRRFADPHELTEALAAAPLLAAFAYAVAGEAWRDPVRRKDPNVASLLRSLTRRMKWEGDRLTDRERHRSATRSDASAMEVL
jgi:hypothetical protein